MTSTPVTLYLVQDECRAIHYALNMARQHCLVLIGSDSLAAAKYTALIEMIPYGLSEGEIANIASEARDLHSCGGAF